MDKGIKKLFGFFVLFLLIIAVVIAASYEYSFNPFTGRQDRTRSTNQSGTNWIFENVSGISLDEIENPAASKTFSIGGNTIAWRFTNPIGGMLWSWEGGARGHLIEFVETVSHANGGHLLHVNATSANMVAGHFHHELDDEAALLVDNGIVNFSTNDGVHVIGDLFYPNMPSLCPTGYRMLGFTGDNFSQTTCEASEWTRTGTTLSPTNAGDNVSVGTSDFFVDNSNGRVGIKTTTPGQELEVNGDILVADNATVRANGAGVISFGNTVGGYFDMGGDSATSVMSARNNDLYYRWGRTGTDSAQTITFQGQNLAGDLQTYLALGGHDDITANSAYGLFSVPTAVRNTKNNSALTVREAGYSALDIQNYQSNANTYALLRFWTWGAGVLSSSDGSYIQSIGLGNNNIDMAFGTYASTGTITEAMRIKNNGNVGIGTTSPTYPLTIGTNVSGISLYTQANISATGFITRTSVYDKSQGSALDKIKDANLYKKDEKIDHSAFYGYTSWTTNETDYSKPVTEMIETEECDDNGCHNVTIEETYYPNTIEVLNEGVSIDKEIDLLRQAVYELKTELCKKDNTYVWCK